MSSEKKKLDDEIEKQAKLNRKFNIDDAMSEMMGGSLGESPVAKLEQVEMELSQLIDEDLNDVYGSLKITLKKVVVNSESIVAEYLDEPMLALHKILNNILDKDQSLYDFVKRVDSEYGRMYQEKPMFQKAGEAAKSGDVYTHESVKESLLEFKGKLS